MKWEQVIGPGRGPHLAKPGEDTCVDQRPVQARLGKEGTAQTKPLCWLCRRIAFPAEAARAEAKQAREAKKEIAKKT